MCLRGRSGTNRAVSAAKKTRPKRLDAAAARAGILDAAEKRLVAAGPSGIRLQDVARDAGVSHPTVLHHFGSREALVHAVTARALDGIHDRLVSTISASGGGEGPLGAMLESVFEALSGGQGRVLLWLALEGHALEGIGGGLAGVVEASHALRKERHSGRGKLATPKREDTARVVVLAALALCGSTVLGPNLYANAGLGTAADEGPRFRAWLARLLAKHLLDG